MTIKIHQNLVLQRKDCIITTGVPTDYKDT